ncbi:MAG: ATP-binding protein [Candidatus Promineifilaceae bacterium]|nr:ATP-binding protein [Candidatus Promineifilaceae bacterium]
MAKEKILTVPGRYDQIQVICQFVADGARQAGLADDDVFHVELCCDEATTNIIEHAYGKEDVGPIQVTYEISHDSFTVTLHDDGRPFVPDDVPEPQYTKIDFEDKGEALDDVLNSLQIGGLGIFFMRKLMDEVFYSFNGVQGNKLVLVKKLQPKE